MNQRIPLAKVDYPDGTQGIVYSDGSWEPPPPPMMAGPSPDGRFYCCGRVPERVEWLAALMVGNR